MVRAKKIINGELAHLARALAWQARGKGFDSPILHNLKVSSGRLLIAYKVSDYNYV